MGNLLSDNYNFEKEPFCTAGPNGLWKVYKGSKKIDKKPICIFVFEKKSLDKDSLKRKEQALALIRNESHTLAKLKHPGMLSIVQHNLEDSKMLAYVTEPFAISLQTLINNGSCKELIPCELELKTMFYDFIDTVSFLHNIGKLYHLNISPDSIFITSDGKLKLGTPTFAIQSNENEAISNIDYTFLNPQCTLVPNLQFSSPELTTTGKVTEMTDTFSLCLTIYTMVKLADCSSKKSLAFLSFPDAYNKAQHIEECKKLGNVKIFDISGPLNALISSGIQAIPSQRCRLKDLQSAEWFKDPLVKVINYLEHLDEKEQQQKIQFLNGLLTVIHKFDPRIINKKITPCLVRSMNLDLFQYSLPVLFAILSKEDIISKQVFVKEVWPSIAKACKGKEISAQSLLIIIQNQETY